MNIFKVCAIPLIFSASIAIASGPAKKTQSQKINSSASSSSSSASVAADAAQASAPSESLAYPHSAYKRAEFEEDKQKFLASGMKYKEFRRGTGTECGGSYGHWFYKKIDGSVTHSFNNSSGFSDERDAWLFQAYAHNDSIAKVASNGWSANHADVSPSANSLLEKLAHDVTTPPRRTAVMHNGSMQVAVDDPHARTDWLAEQLESNDKGPLLQQLFVGLWRNRDRTLVAAIDNAQRTQESNRNRGVYLSKEQNSKIAEQVGCDCRRPTCEKTKWKIARFENAAVYDHTIRTRELPLGVFPAWIQMQQGKFRISKSTLANAQQPQRTLSSNPQFQHAIANPVYIAQGAPGGPIEIKPGQAASSSSNG